MTSKERRLEWLTEPKPIIYGSVEPSNPYPEPVQHAPDCHYEDEPCTPWCAWEGGRDVERYGGTWPG